MGEDVLALLLPEASAEERSEIRRVITALRLLRDDARIREARRVEPSWWNARRELEQLERQRCARAIEGLLHAYLSAVRPPSSFLDLGPSPMEHGAAWRILLCESEFGPTRPPDPLEPPQAVIERLLAAVRKSGAAPEWCDLWSARADHVLKAPAEAEQRWKNALRSARAGGAGPQWVARCAAGLVASRLERFDPARAFALHSAAPELMALEPSLRRALGWAALLCGAVDVARELLEPFRDPRARLPLPLAELRSSYPEWSGLLTGTKPEGAPSSGPTIRAERHNFGALLLGAFVRQGGAPPRVLKLDAAPDLRARAQRLVGSAPIHWAPWDLSCVRRLHRHASEPGPLPAALAGSRTVALAQVPLLDASGCSRGWLQLESEHHLLPCSAQLEAEARACCRALEHENEGLVVVGAPTPAPVWSLYSPGDPRHEFVRRLFGALGPLSGLRALWVEPDEQGIERVRAIRGGPAGEGEARSQWADASRRFRELRENAGYDCLPTEPANSSAKKGVVLPLADARGVRVLGVLALESESRGILPALLIEAARAALRALEPLWWFTGFRAAGLLRDGNDLAWEPERRFLSTIEPALRATADSRTPLLLVGAPGSGRRTLARWLHFRGPAAGLAFVEGRDIREAGTRVLDLDGIDRATQLELALALAQGSRERLFLLGSAPAHVLRERGLLERELERHMDPLPLAVPPLCDRRDEIPALVKVLAGNVARRESLALADFQDDALAHLWRQSWRGGVPELASLVGQLARAHSGRAIGPADVCAAFRARRLEFRERLPSLRPRPLDLELALATTRHDVGSENRARAARYLGWDPGTLENRLREIGPQEAGRSAGDMGPVPA
ncbi:MAG: hypothetical protein HOP15_14460 [Planctomycetes bacterium]|nr:hypothetical protein [Planctomycetota bacterium]